MIRKIYLFLIVIMISQSVLGMEKEEEITTDLFRTLVNSFVRQMSHDLVNRARTQINITSGDLLTLETTAQKNNLLTIKEFVDKNPEKINNVFSGSGCTLLYSAVSDGETEIAKFLLSQKNNDNRIAIEVDKGCIYTGNSPLFVANSLAMCQLLIENGASLKRKNAAGMTPFAHQACSHKDKGEILKFMMSHGVNPNEKINKQPLLLRLINQQYQHNIPILLEGGMEVTWQVIDQANKEGLDLQIIQLLQDYRNAVKCPACPKWYPESVHQNQENFVCGECKEKRSSESGFRKTSPFIAMISEDETEFHCFYRERDAVTGEDRSVKYKVRSSSEKIEWIDLDKQEEK